MTEEKVWAGSALKTERETAGVKLQDLALTLGMSQSALSLMENGIRPVREDLPARYLSTLRRIVRERAEAFGFEVLDHPADAPEEP